MYQVAKRCKSWKTRLKPLAVMALVVLFRPLSIADAQQSMIPTPAGWDDLKRESLQTAIKRSIDYLEKLPPDRIVGEQPRLFTAKEILDALHEFEYLLARGDCRECWTKEFAARFELIPSSSDPELETVLFTGYYQPVIEASLVPTADYAYPIYGKPADLIVAEQVTLAPEAKTEKVVGRVQGDDFMPYYSRREIDEVGSLRGRGYEIAWVKNPVDLFFLHIQGSGILQLTDGRRLHVGYAGANGRRYRSIGRLLIDRGKIPEEEMSMQRLRRYLEDHPEERNDIMAYNESYIFFRFLRDDPLGSLEVPLTAGRSIATDAKLFPKGALALIVAQKPIVDATGQLVGWEPFSRFVLNQDTGGAIRGSQRVDIYFGPGNDAGAQAGFMKSPGKLYFLSLKNPPSGSKDNSYSGNPIARKLPLTP
jgi:membrane-bound lytic murein transglycosylase A